MCAKRGFEVIKLGSLANVLWTAVAQIFACVDLPGPTPAPRERLSLMGGRRNLTFVSVRLAPVEFIPIFALGEVCYYNVGLGVHALTLVSSGRPKRRTPRSWYGVRIFTIRSLESLDCLWLLLVAMRLRLS